MGRKAREETVRLFRLQLSAQHYHDPSYHYIGRTRPPPPPWKKHSKKTHCHRKKPPGPTRRRKKSKSIFCRISATFSAAAAARSMMSLPTRGERMPSDKTSPTYCHFVFSDPRTETKAMLCGENEKRRGGGGVFRREQSRRDSRSPVFSLPVLSRVPFPHPSVLASHFLEKQLFFARFTPLLQPPSLPTGRQADRHIVLLIAFSHPRRVSHII